MLNASRATGPEATILAVATRPDGIEAVRRRLAASLGQNVYEAWFRGLDLAGVDCGVATFTVATKFLKTWIATKYSDRLTDAARAEIEGVVRVEVVVRSASVARALPVPQQADLRPSASVVSVRAASVDRRSFQSKDSLSGSPVDKRNDFSTYVVGDANASAIVAARSFSSNPAGVLYVHAATGLGKTHLLHAMANSVSETGRPVLYFTAEKFIYKGVPCLGALGAGELRQALSGYGFVAVDDLQFLQGPAAATEFRRLLRAAAEVGVGLAVAADREPDALPHLQADVVTALTARPIVCMAALGLPERVALLRGKLEAARAKFPSFEVSDEVCGFVAEAVTTNNRDLDGAAGRLLAYSCVNGNEPLTRKSAFAAITDLVRNGEVKKIKIEDVQNLVANHYNVSRGDIMSAKRTANVVRPRQVAMYISKVATRNSLPEIGRRFGGRDHTTVLHAVRKIESLRDGNRAFSEEVGLLIEMLKD